MTNEIQIDSIAMRPMWRDIFDTGQNFSRRSLY